MQGSLTLHRGVLYVGRNDKTAHVRAFDLDGRALRAGFSFRDERLARSVAAGLAVDEDRFVWVADTPASRLRTFTLFGREVGGLGLGLDEPLDPHEVSPADDVAGRVRHPVDVEVRGDSDRRHLAVACGGERRHAVQLFDGAGRFLGSLRPRGDARGSFHGVRGIGWQDRYLYVAESGAGRVQVFRDGEFHFDFGHRPRFEPSAVAPLEDGRLVVACVGQASSLLLFDATGRLLRTLAGSGHGEGAVLDPADVVVEPGLDDAHTRVAVIDRDGERVQVFTLEGRCYGAFEGRAV